MATPVPVASRSSISGEGPCSAAARDGLLEYLKDDPAWSVPSQISLDDLRPQATPQVPGEPTDSEADVAVVPAAEGPTSGLLTAGAEVAQGSCPTLLEGVLLVPQRRPEQTRQ